MTTLHRLSDGAEPPRIHPVDKSLDKTERALPNGAMPPTIMSGSRWSALLLIAWIRVCLPAEGHEIEVDFQRTNGVIRPLQGVNSGPLCYRGTIDLSAYHRELAVPLTRLHDVVWLNAEAVDIHTVYPDFRNDPERPDSYAFAATDDYIQAIVNVGSGIVYRLGESIEHTPRKYHVQPPAEPSKWAAICLGIIRHYNAGWANGFHHHIPYWEIWNEPDVRPAMWTGTDADYFQLYGTAAKAIKAHFPTVKVGGPALGGTGRLNRDGFAPSPFLTNFLAFCREQGAPLDFFSWHCYTSNPWELEQRATAVRHLLNDFGFTNTESHLNEWNYLPDNDWSPILASGQGAARAAWYRKMGSAAGAAFAASSLMLFQAAPLDAANFYTGEVQGFGLFDFNGVPKLTFYAFKAFRSLLDTPVQVETRGAVPEDTSVLAGMNAARTRASLLLANFRSRNAQFKITFRNPPGHKAMAYQARAIDETHRLTGVREGVIPPEDSVLEFEVSAPSVLLLELHQVGSLNPERQ